MTQAEVTAEWKRLRDTWGLDGWELEFTNRSKKRLGCCCYREKKIQLSEFHVENDPTEHVVDTLRHEVAHALAGSAAAHGPAWKTWATKVGATPERCPTQEQARELARQPGKWFAVCPRACGYVAEWYGKPKMRKGRYYFCRTCGHDARLIPVERQQATPKPPTQTRSFKLF